MRQRLVRLLGVALVGAALPLIVPAAGTPATAAAAACADPLLEESQPVQDALSDVPDAEVAETNDVSVSTLRDQAEDDAVWLDPCGRLFVVDHVPAPDAAAAEVAQPATAAATPDAFALHSRPGAAKTLYLDFRGRTLTGTAWNSTARPSITLGPYSADADTTTFSTSERATIAAVWESVAADYAAFDVDVTTQDPTDAALVRSSASDTRYGMRVLVAGDSSGMQADCRCGGVAYIDVFGETGSRYQPALVFSEALASAKSIAEAASHEAGHTFGLFHDGDATADYHQGSRPWAPIMGVGYSQPVTQWSKGEYAGATNQQDDTAIIAAKLGVVADDYPGTTSLAAATPLTSGATGLVTGPADADSFAVAATGAVTVTARPATTWSDLDVQLTVTDESGHVTQTVNPVTTRTSAAVAQGLDAAVTLSPGRHVVTVRGGSGPTYSAYGSIGRYAVTVAGAVDPDPLVGATAVPPAVIGRAYDAALVSGGTPPYTWSGTPDVPGLSFGADGHLRGTPTAVMAAALATPTVQDADGRALRLTGWSTFTVETALTLPAQTLPAATAGSAYEHVLDASGSPDGYRWSATGLPAGLTLSTSGRLIGTPARAGTSTPTVTVASAHQRQSVRLTLVVRPGAPAVATTGLPRAVAGSSYRTRLAATGGTGTYRWTQRGLPAGLRLTSGGLVLGTPRTSGTAHVTLTVASGTSTAHRTLVLAVARPVAVATRTVGRAAVDRPYRSVVRTAGGLPTYAWKASGLPRGVRIVHSGDGTKAVLKGTPRTTGTFRVKVRVVDATGRTASRTLVLRVAR